MLFFHISHMYLNMVAWILPHEMEHLHLEILVTRISFLERSMVPMIIFRSVSDDSMVWIPMGLFQVCFLVSSDTWLFLIECWTSCRKTGENLKLGWWCHYPSCLLLVGSSQPGQALNSSFYPPSSMSQEGFAHLSTSAVPSRTSWQSYGKALSTFLQISIF